MSVRDLPKRSMSSYEQPQLGRREFCALGLGAGLLCAALRSPADLTRRPAAGAIELVVSPVRTAAILSRSERVVQAAPVLRILISASSPTSSSVDAIQRANEARGALAARFNDVIAVPTLAGGHSQIADILQESPLRAGVFRFIDGSAAELAALERVLTVSAALDSAVVVARSVDISADFCLAHLLASGLISQSGVNRVLIDKADAQLAHFADRLDAIRPRHGLSDRGGDTFERVRDQIWLSTAGINYHLGFERIRDRFTSQRLIFASDDSTAYDVTRWAEFHAPDAGQARHMTSESARTFFKSEFREGWLASSGARRSM